MYPLDELEHICSVRGFRLVIDRAYAIPLVRVNAYREGEKRPYWSRVLVNGSVSDFWNLIREVRQAE